MWVTDIDPAWTALHEKVGCRFCGDYVKKPCTCKVSTTLRKASSADRFLEHVQALLLPEASAAFIGALKRGYWDLCFSKNNKGKDAWFLWCAHFNQPLIWSWARNPPGFTIWLWRGFDSAEAASLQALGWESLPAITTHFHNDNEVGEAAERVVSATLSALGHPFKPWSPVRTRYERLMGPPLLDISPV